MQRIFIIVLGVGVALLVAACNANSDAVHVVETQNISLQATIASYGYMSATVTAQATTVAQELEAARITLTAVNAQVKDLTNKMNAGVSQPVIVPSSLSTGNLDSTPAINGTPGSAVQKDTSTGFSFATVVTSKGKDTDGCAVGQATAFNATDPSIWVVADVRNYKRGTVFTAKWAGDNFSREDSWTVSSDGAQICVHFYIQPKTLALQPGNYTVTMSAGSTTAQPVQFTIQSSTSQAGAATPSQAPS